MELKIVVTFGEKVIIGNVHERGFWMLLNLIWIMVNKYVQKQKVLSCNVRHMYFIVRILYLTTKLNEPTNK